MRGAEFDEEEEEEESDGAAALLQIGTGKQKRKIGIWKKKIVIEKVDQ